jgi:putative ABC transport system substrate-binding protein
MRGLVVVKRRAVVALLGSAVVARPFATEAQQRTNSVVGFLHSASSGQIVDLVAAFRTGLVESGFSEGQNVAIEYRWADNEPERLPALAANLVEQKVDVIAAAGGDRSAIAAKRATSKIPIVAVIGGDPVAEGLVTSLSRPGGNLTGVSFLTAALTAKRLDLILELAPKTKVAALLVNSRNPQTSMVVHDLEKTASAKGLELHVLTARSLSE